MNYVSGFRLTIPKPIKGEIIREELIRTISDCKVKITYIQAGAGYGKTTLLSQLANSASKAVWLSLAGENDVFTFVNVLCQAVKHTFPNYDFNSSEYITFNDNENFVSILTEALTSSMENLSKELLIVFDDLHTIKDTQIKEFIACFLKYLPESIRIYLSSREAPWQELMPFYVRGLMLMIEQKKLVFSEKETAVILGYSNENIYKITEGWPLAVNAFRVLEEDGVLYTDTPSKGKEVLYSYLFYECINHLPIDIVDFLKASSCFEELDTQMMDNVLGKNNSVYIMEALMLKNIFTIKINKGLYRYHALFRECLQDTVDAPTKYLLQYKAAQYYWTRKKYSEAAQYAILLEDKKLLQKIILTCYKELMKSGNFSELRLWFNELGDEYNVSEPEFLVAKGAFLSTIGNFTQAKDCLDTALPMLKEGNNDLYIEAMIHKARVFRNCISFEESNLLLDKLSDRIGSPASETGYSVIIERLYNYCWNSQIQEAYSLAHQSIEACLRDGNLRIKDWYERYLCAVCFFAGNMKEAIRYYEKSLELPENERQYLDIHEIGIYAAKAYQMLGDRERSLTLLSEELQKIKNTGKYEEMWSAYLFAAEIHYQNTFIDIMNGKPGSYEETRKYFELADEYASLYRKTQFQLNWTKMQRLTYSLIFTDKPKKGIVEEINANINEAGAYLKCILYARLLGYYAAVADYPNAVKCAIQCIQTGEKSGMLMHPALAYGILARASITTGERDTAEKYVKRYLKLCYELGCYDYFHMRKYYDPILQFSITNSIEPEIGRFFAEFCGYKIKKAYIKTFGEFNILSYDGNKSPLKMRTRKERELFAFLLDAGEYGATKDQIYNAIWSESDSENIKKVIGVNLTQIKNDLARFGIKNAIISREKRYSINREELECDFELYEEAAADFEKSQGHKEAMKLISIYTGEYLADFEALWAIAKRLKYHNIYEKAISLCVPQ